jgi:hypothetical protein
MQSMEGAGNRRKGWLRGGGFLYPALARRVGVGKPEPIV